MCYVEGFEQLLCNSENTNFTHETVVKRELCFLLSFNIMKTKWKCRDQQQSFIEHLRK